MLMEDLYRGAADGHQTDQILLDFSKALDKNIHEKRIIFFHKYGIRKNTLQWIRSFLSNRFQQVVNENEKSDTVPVTSGVPQGSVLGPILFLIYINDLPESVRSRVRLFTDDTAVYLAVSSLQDAQLLQQDLDTLSVWEHKWDMEFNPSKCTVIQDTRSKVPIQSTYTLQGQVLETVSSARYLGVDVASDLTWTSQVNRVCASGNRTLGFVKRNINSALSGIQSPCTTSA